MDSRGVLEALRFGRVRPQVSRNSGHGGQVFLN